MAHALTIPRYRDLRAGLIARISASRQPYARERAPTLACQTRRQKSHLPAEEGRDIEEYGPSVSASLAGKLQPELGLWIELLHTIRKGGDHGVGKIGPSDALAFAASPEHAPAK